VLQSISFQVQPGELIGVLGPNGSGKTTLVLALSGIVPLQKGRVEIQGSALGDWKAAERARRMAVVAQDAEVRFPFSCEEVVRMGRYPHRKRWQADSAHDEERVKWSMQLTDTHVLAERLITAVSGGERQRVMMARALAQETPILLLDESTSAMDVHRKLEMFRILEDLSSRERLTVLAVLHDINLAALFCRRMIFLKNGQIAADGPPEMVLTEKILEEVYQSRVVVREIEEIGRRQVVFLP
jgi:iron complex transport system ATP-binding protein